MNVLSPISSSWPGHPICLAGKGAPRYCCCMADGRYYDKEGYVRVLVGDILVGEHRIVLEQKLGRALGPHEVAHHVNEVKDDNRPENLEVKTRSQHSKDHAVRVEPVLLTCPICFKSFPIKTRKYRERLKHESKMYCSRSCNGVAARNSQLGTSYVKVDHGTLGAYFRCPKPRCDLCRSAMRDYKRNQRNRILVSSSTG
jgi:hypothetical protein